VAQRRWPRSTRDDRLAAPAKNRHVHDLIRHHRRSCPRARTRRRGALKESSLLASHLRLISLVAALALTPVAHARESLAVAAPFEVGESPDGNYLAALVAGAERDTLASATYFREALRADPRNPQLIERAFVAALSNGNFADVFPLAERLLARDGNNGLARLALGVRALKAHRWADARAQLSRGGSGVQRDITSTLLMAWSWAGQGDTRRAVALADSLRDDSTAVFRDYHAALIFKLAGDDADALKRITSAYGAEKGTLRLVDAYARIQNAAGDHNAARDAYLAFDQLIPHHPLVTAALADIKAGAPLQPVVKNAEQGAGEVLYGLGAAGGRQGDELAAMIYLRLALFLAPQNGLATVTLADIYERVKQNEAAIDVYESVPQSSPLRQNADIQMGLTLDALGKSDQAIAHLQALVDEHPKDVEALTTLGNLQRARKDFAKAAATYTRAIDQSGPADRNSWPLFYFRGISRERDKKWPLAEADFKQALALFPDQPLVLNYLGYSWVEQGIHLDEALTMLRKAVELRATDGYVVDSLGWAYFKLGRFDDAARELEKAIELKASDPVINNHLGDAYWRVGRKLEAHFQWNHARDLKPEPDDLAEILKKIDNGLPELDKPAAADAETKKNGG